MRPTIALCALALAALSTAHAAGGVTLFVAPNGRDTNPGTRAKPFATPARARDAVRAGRAAGRLRGAVTVEIAAGRYELAAPLTFGPGDSGTAAAPVVYRAARGAQVRLVGGKGISRWAPVADPALLSRMAPEARGHALQADLKALGVTDLQGINSAQVYQSDPGLELFFGGKPMTLARYPNQGYMHITEALGDGVFACDDRRPMAWAGEPEVWLHGFWMWDWADERKRLDGIDTATGRLTLGKPNHGYGMKKGQWFYAQNALPELDTPGEWYVDRASGLLLFWPPSPVDGAEAVVSTVRDMVRFEGCSHVTLRGLTVEQGRGSAVVVKGGEGVRVVACTLRNMGNWGVRVTGGKLHGVVGCDVTQTGQGGIHLEGGDRKTLTPAGHTADNNHVHHTARWDPVYQQGITLFGVGNRATHNLIDNVPHVAIGFSGNEQTIEYNEIHSSVFQSNDAGAVYTSPPDETWSMRGHKIRFNYLHHIHGFEGKGCLGVYLDDCFSSADISGNVFYDVATPILIGGGRDNTMANNLFVKCGRAFSIDARGLGWAKSVGDFATKELHDLNYKQPPWSVKYPQLLGILEDEPLAPKGNLLARNVCWGGPWGWVEEAAKKGLKEEENLVGIDPLFVAPPPAGFALKPGSPALKAGFLQIPFGKIGLYKSADRATWPVASEVRAK